MTDADASPKMDSDDEFNSSMSGNDFDEDSDMDLEEGELLRLPVATSHADCVT